jgi:DNA-binding transcriptional MerR regulator
LAGVSSRTIDYYTQIGIINESTRSPGKHRLYSEESLQTIRIIKELQKQHYSLHEICQLFNQNKNDEIIEKIANIRRCLESLQKEVVELCPAVRLSGPNDQVRVVSTELINKSIQVLQGLIIMLGEPML